MVVDVVFNSCIMRDMSIVKSIDIKALTKSYENKWVALSRGYKKVLAAADTLRSLTEKVDLKDVVVLRVLPSGVGYAPDVRT